MSDGELQMRMPIGHDPSYLETVIGAAIAMWDGVLAGHVENPRSLTQREFIADRLSRHFDFIPKRDAQG